MQFGIKKSIEDQQYALGNELADRFENVLQRIDRYLDDVRIKEENQEAAQMGVRDIQYAVCNLLPDQDQQVVLQPQAVQPLLQIQDAVDQRIQLIEQAEAVQPQPQPQPQPQAQQPPPAPPEQLIRLVTTMAVRPVFHTQYRFWDSC